MVFHKWRQMKITFLETKDIGVIISISETLPVSLYKDTAVIPFDTVVRLKIVASPNWHSA
jgi:hypothetical protein